jgi:TPP-dependent 2-oxoacid decarboxylase
MQIDNGEPELTNGIEKAIPYVPIGLENDDISMPTFTTSKPDAQEVFPQEEVTTEVPPTIIPNGVVGEVSTEVTTSAFENLTTVVPDLDKMTPEVTWASLTYTTPNHSSLDSHIDTSISNVRS